MKEEICCTCGIRFGLDDKLHAQRLQDGRSFYCPDGHAQHYAAPCDKDKKAEIAELEKQVEHWKAAYQRTWDEWQKTAAELTTARLRVAGYKSQWLRLKREKGEADV